MVCGALLTSSMASWPSQSGLCLPVRAAMTVQVEMLLIIKVTPKEGVRAPNSGPLLCDAPT